MWRSAAAADEPAYNFERYDRCASREVDAPAGAKATDGGGGVFFFSRRTGLTTSPPKRGSTPTSTSASSNATSKASIPPPPPPPRESPLALPEVLPETLDRTTSIGSESVSAASLPFWSKREQVSYDEDAIVERGKSRCGIVASQRGMDADDILADLERGDGPKERLAQSKPTYGPDAHGPMVSYPLTRGTKARSEISTSSVAYVAPVLGARNGRSGTPGSSSPSGRASKMQRSLEKLQSKRMSDASAKSSRGEGDTEEHGRETALDKVGADPSVASRDEGNEPKANNKGNSDDASTVASDIPMKEVDGAILRAASSLSVQSSKSEISDYTMSTNGTGRTGDIAAKSVSFESQPADGNACIPGGCFGWCRADGTDDEVSEQRDQDEGPTEQELDGTRDGIDGNPGGMALVRSKIIYRSKVVPGVEAVPYGSGTVLVDSVSLKIDDVACKLETRREKRKERQQRKRLKQKIKLLKSSTKRGGKTEAELLDRLEVCYEAY